MFSRDDLQHLAEYHGEHPVLSLTLNVDPTERPRDQYRLALRHLLSSVKDRAAEDAQALERFFDREYDWSGRGLAIFSCARDQFWKVYSLPIPIVDSIFIGPKPHITPLANLWDTYGRFVAAVIDRQGAHLLFVQLGEIAAREDSIGQLVRHTKSGVGSTPTGMRRNSDAPTDRKEGEVIKRNLKEIATVVMNFCEQHQPRYLILGGSGEVINEVRDHLSQQWRERLIGTFTADVDDPDFEIRDCALKVVIDYAAERETELADAAITAAAKGNHGSLRLDDTMSAAHAGRVQTLLVSEGYRAEGYRCTKCGYLSALQIELCPFCGSTFEKIPDAVEATISKVLEHKGRVEIVRGHKALAEAGIGALLRY
jgi:peptide subunit release factor 1 (eRF1)